MSKKKKMIIVLGVILSIPFSILVIWPEYNQITHDYNESIFLTNGFEHLVTVDGEDYFGKVATSGECNVNSAKPIWWGCRSSEIVEDSGRKYLLAGEKACLSGSGKSVFFINDVAGYLKHDEVVYVICTDGTIVSAFGKDQEKAKNLWESGTADKIIEAIRIENNS